MSSWTKELDDAAVQATRSGWWHVLIFYLLCGLAAVPTSFLVFSQCFTNATPEHWCAPPQELEALQIPAEVVRNLTIPEEHGIYDSCNTYAINSRALYTVLKDYVDERSEFHREDGSLKIVNIRQLIPAVGEKERNEQILRVIDAILAVRSKEPSSCTNGWIYNAEHYSRTLVTDFNLVCEKEWLPRLSNTLFWVGSIFGNLFFGWMSDRYGRRPTILLMIYLEVPLAIAAAFPSNYWSYTALRVLGGLFFPAMYQLPFILALELMPPTRRTNAGIVVGMLFASGMCLLSLLAFLLRDWFYLSLATSLPFLLLYGYYWLIPESPRWLVSRGRIAEAEKVLRDLAKKNGIILHHGFLLDIHKRFKELEDTEVTISMLSDANGYIPGQSDVLQKEESDRRLSHMHTFQPEPNTSESDDKEDSLEKILALEVADIVNKKSVNVNRNSDVNENADEESRPNCDSAQKSTQTEPRDSQRNSLRKSRIVKKLFGKDVKISDESSQGDCKASILDIFRYPNIRKKFLILTFDWVSLGVVYNSLSYNTSNLGVNDYLAFFIGGAVELPSYFIAWRCIERFGRRWVLCIFMCTGGLACLTCVLVPESMPWVTVALAMLGRLCAAAAFAVFYVLIGELLPTVLRSQAMGAASFIAGLGLLACPYIVHLAVYSRALPLIVIGIVSVSAGMTSLFFPETLNQPLPQTLEDGEAFGRHFKLLSFVRNTRDKNIEYQ